jgi:hypothetical protein
MSISEWVIIPRFHDKVNIRVDDRQYLDGLILQSRSYIVSDNTLIVS